MDRHFVIPATVAAALHAGLLFGVKPGHARPADLKVSEKIIRFVPAVFIEPPAPAEVAEAAPAGAPDAARPVLDEPPPIAPTDVITVPVPAPARRPVTDVVHTIPPGPFGLPDGGASGGFGDPDIAGSLQLDRTPRTRVQAAPVYPFEAKRTNREGEVLVEFIVDETGAVVAPRIVRSSDPVFDEASLRAIARWKFEPGKRDGRVVRFRMAVPLVFSLNAE